MATLDELQQQWAEDAPLRQEKLGDDVSRTPQLHSNYLNELIQYKLRLTKIQGDIATLKSDLAKYFRGEMTREELEEHGWEQWQLRSIKSDIPGLIEGHSDYQKLITRESYCKTAIYFLESVLQEIRSRSFHARTIMDWIRYRDGS